MVNLKYLSYFPLCYQHVPSLGVMVLETVETTAQRVTRGGIARKLALRILPILAWDNVTALTTCGMLLLVTGAPL